MKLLTKSFILINFIIIDPAIAQEAISSESQTKLILFGGSDFSTNLQPDPSDRPSAAQDYEISAALKNSNHKVKASILFGQLWNPGRDEEYFHMDDDSLSYTYTLPKFLKFQDYISPSFDSKIIFPTSNESRAYSKLYSLRETVNFMGEYKYFDYLLLYKGQSNRYRYTTKPVTAGSGYLSDYSNKLGLNTGVSFFENINLALYEELGIIHYFDNFSKGVYLFTQTLTYNFKNWEIHIGHSIGDDTRTDHDSKNNIKTFSKTESQFVAGLSCSLNI